MADHTWPYQFEGAVFETPAFTYDSMAAWYLVRWVQDATLGSKARVRAKLEQLEDELLEQPSTSARVMNDIYADDGRVFTLPDGSRVLQVEPAHPETPDGVFCLYRFTGDLATGDDIYVDFAWNPPVASLQEPLSGNWEPAKTSLETRTGAL